jgi:NAD kinase
MSVVMPDASSSSTALVRLPLSPLLVPGRDDRLACIVNDTRERLLLVFSHGYVTDLSPGDTLSISVARATHYFVKPHSRA